MSQAPKTVYIGGDQNGRPFKDELKKFMTEKGVKFVDLGVFDKDTTDYSLIEREISEKLAEEENALGVLVLAKNKNESQKTSCETCT